MKRFFFLTVRFLAAAAYKGSLTVCALYAFFLIPRTLHFSFWCDACSISAVGESNGKSQLANPFFFLNSYTLERNGR